MNKELDFTSKNYFFPTALVGSFCIHLSFFYILYNTNFTPLKQEQQIQTIQMSILEEKREIPKEQPIVQPTVKPKKPPPKPKPEIKKIQKPKIMEKKVPQVPMAIPKQETPSIDTAEKIVEPLIQEQTVVVASKQTPSNTEEQKNSFLSAYLSKVRTQIQANLYYPPRAKKFHLEGKAIVSFLIKKDGSIDESSLKIIHSSGKKILDISAIESIIQAAPFESSPQGELSINIPVIFKLKI